MRLAWGKGKFMSYEDSAIIGIDWGTSSLRAWLLDGKGSVNNFYTGAHGISQIADKDFAAVLALVLGELGPKASNAPIIMCGMIGSAQGWRDAGYLQKSAGIAELAAAAIPLQHAPSAWIVPGVQSVSADGLADVMRGEETALAGIMASQKITEGLFCLPGTHSKWVVIEESQITSLSTFMTGEVFQLMRQHSILSPLMPELEQDASEDGDGFIQGLELAAGKLGLLHQLFAVRAGILTGQFNSASAASILSGLAIGSEIKHITRLAQAQPTPIFLNAAGVMAHLYQTALAHFNIECQLIDGEEASRAGLYEIACHILYKMK